MRRIRGAYRGLSFVLCFLLIFPSLALPYFPIELAFAAEDVNPPEVSITSPTGGNISGTVDISVYATDDIGVTNVEFYIDGAKIGESGVSPYVYSWNTTEFADGNHAIFVKAYDAANNIGTSNSVTVNINNGIIPDTENPIVSITSTPPSGSTLNALGDQVTISATASDAVGVTKVEYYVDGAKVGESVYAPYTYNWQSTAGHHTLSAKAYDAAGNIGVSNNAIIDVPTRITITNPADGSTLGGVKTTFNAIFTDPLTGYIRLFIDGVQVNWVSYIGQSVSSVSIPYTWDTNQYANGTSHIIEIQGYTYSGSVLSKGRSTVTVDNSIDVTAPSISITSNPPSGSTLNALGDQVTINATASDAVGVTKVEYYVDGAKVGESVYAPYTYNWQSTAGHHTLSAKAYDAAGNIGLSNNATIDVPTRITITNPVDGSTLGGVKTTFNATFTDPLTGYIRLYIDGVRKRLINGCMVITPWT